MTGVRRLATILAVAALLLVGVGVIVGGPEPGIEGAYFNRSVGADTAVFLGDDGGLLDPGDGNLWLGAGLGLALAAAATFTVARRHRSRLALHEVDG